jgi:DNA-directed RNA polymerase sigma subunit (sigma70/sigma32)
MTNRVDVCECAHGGARDVHKNDVPGARVWETPEETEGRKWVAYLMRCRPRSLSSTEKRVLDHLYAITDDTRRSTCGEIASDLGLSGPKAVHKIEAAALEKIGYERRSSRT